MSGIDRQLTVSAMLLVGLSGCMATNPIPGATTTALNGSWTVQNGATQHLFQFPSPNANVNIQPQGAYVVTFWATSPSGVTRSSWSGNGAFFCYNGPYVTPTNPTQGNAGPSGFIGMEPGSWPASASTFNPPQATTALLNSSFRVPCGPGGKQGYADIAAGNGTPGRFSFVSPSSETVTAIATDASGARITATLTMTVVSSGGL
jgi:hypothetical protein